MADLHRTLQRWRSAYDRARYTGKIKASVVPLVVTLILGLVLGLWLARYWMPNESGAASDQAQLTEGLSDPSEAPGGLSLDERDSTSVQLGRCAEVYAAQAPSLRAVGPAMTQWEVHIGAMNKLVVGAISLAQAQQFWNQTRHGAARNLEKFGDAQHVYQQRTARCPSPSGQASKSLRECAAVVTAQHRELTRAAVALDTWRTHVHHMEMLRRGEMSAEDATQVWLASWRAGARQVDAYRSAARDAQQVPSSHRQHHNDTDGPCTGQLGAG